MTLERLSRRLLSALAGSTPAFTRSSTVHDQSRTRRLLVALAGSSPAFTPNEATDQHTTPARPTTDAAVQDVNLGRYLAERKSPANKEAAALTSRDLAGGLDAFAVQLAALTPGERLEARKWLPEHRLAIVRFFARVESVDLILARDIDLGLSRTSNRDITYSLDLIRALVGAHALVDTRSQERTRDLGLVRILDLARDLARDLAGQLSRLEDFASARDLARDLADNLAQLPESLGRALGLAHGLAIEDLDFAYARDLDRSLAYTLDLALDLTLTVALARCRIRHVQNELGRTFDRAVSQTLSHGRFYGLSQIKRKLVTAIGQILIVVTDVSGADLTQDALHGVPLAGVRWSDRTRWPTAWHTWVHENSVTLSENHYEIRPGLSDARPFARLLT